MSVDSSIHRSDVLFFFALLICALCCFSCNADETEGALRQALNRLKRGEDGRGDLFVQQKEQLPINEHLLLRLGETSISHFGLFDVLSIKTNEDGVGIAEVALPQIRVTSSLKVIRPLVDSTSDGEAILRFLDSKLLLELVVDDAAVKKAQLSLKVGTVTTAFDLELSEPGQNAELQVELMKKKEYIEELFQKIVEKEFARLITNVNHETEAALSNPVSFSPKVEQANRFVDQLLSDNRKALEDAISYVKLPDEYFEFSKKIAFIETHGYAKLTKGHLNNLHAISRKGDCVLFAKDDVLNVVVDLGLDNVLGAYYIDVAFGVFGATSDLKLKIDTVELVIKGLNSFREISDQDSAEQNNVLDFDLALNIKANVGHIDVDVNISKVIDWLINFIAEKVVSSLKGRLQNMIKDPIRDAIKGIINGTF